MRTRLPLLLVLFAVACGEEARVEATGIDTTATVVVPDPAEDRFAITNEADDVKLALTDEVVYFWLSEEAQAEMQKELDEGLSNLGETAGRFARALSREVTGAVMERFRFSLDRVEDVRYEDGRLVFDFAGGDDPFAGFEVNGRPITEGFAPEDARAFVDAFHDVKR